MKYKLKRQEKDDRDIIFSAAPKKAIPKAVDLRSLMPGVYNQLELGSCTANSSVAYTEYLNKNSINLSRLFEYYKTRELEGTIDEDAGAMIRTGIKTLKEFGETCQYDFIENVVEVKCSPTIDDLEKCAEIAKEMAKRLKESR